MCQAIDWANRAHNLRQDGEQALDEGDATGLLWLEQAEELEDRVAHWLGETFDYDLLERALRSHWQAEFVDISRGEVEDERREHNALML